MGERAAGLLLDAIEGRGEPATEPAARVALQAELVVRTSCGAPTHHQKLD